MVDDEISQSAAVLSQLAVTAWSPPASQSALTTTPWWPLSTTRATPCPAPPTSSAPVPSSELSPLSVSLYGLLR